MTEQPEVGLTGRAPTSPCDFYVVGLAEIPAGRFEKVATVAEGWACGMFAKVTQGATKKVTGYLCAGEFELENSAPNASAMSCVTLNWINKSSVPGVPGGSTQAYIQLRDYSSGTPCSNLFEFTDVTIGNAADVLITDYPDGAYISQAIKFTVKNVPYWILCSDTFH